MENHERLTGPCLFICYSLKLGDMVNFHQRSLTQSVVVNMESPVMCMPKQWLFKYFPAKGLWKRQYLFFCVSTDWRIVEHPQEDHTFCLPGLVNMTLLGKGVRGDTINSQIQRWQPSCATQVGPKSNEKCPHERQRRMHGEKKSCALGGQNWDAEAAEMLAAIVIPLNLASHGALLASWFWLVASGSRRESVGTY